MQTKFLYAAAIAILLIAAGFFYNKYKVAPAVKFETLTLTDLEGNSFDWQNLSGKKVFVNFWATWCGPCLSEMKDLQDAQQLLASEAFTFICISDEPIEVLKNFKKRTGNQLIFLHLKQKLGEISVHTIPCSYLLSAEGKIVYKKIGVEMWSSSETIKLLKEKAE